MANVSEGRTPYCLTESDCAALQLLKRGSRTTHSPGKSEALSRALRMLARPANGTLRRIDKILGSVKVPAGFHRQRRNGGKFGANRGKSNGHIKQVLFTLQDGDKELVERIKRRWKLSNGSEAVRLAIRVAASLEGFKS